jgi:hypothetical protein
MARSSFWWVIEIGIPVAGVLVGVALLLLAALALVMGETARMPLFWAGLASWASGIAWGAFVNDGIGLRRWLVGGAR